METAEPFLTFITEIAKLLLTFVADIIHYIAWPAVVLIILLVFRNKLRDLIGRFLEYEYEYKGRRGKFKFSTTEKPPSPQLPEDTEMPPELSKEAKKILATLWDRQMYHFKDDSSRRWSFRVLPQADEYGVFMQGFAELLKSDLVNWTRKDGQALLTGKGLRYLKLHSEIQESDDMYRF